jgi:outer membrane receptor protein involved in Fe transport
MAGVLIRNSFLAIGLVALTAGSDPATAAADETSESGGLQEVLVTATRREERLQDVPISVTTFSQEKIDAQGLKNIDDLARLTPNLTFSRTGVGNSTNYNDENSDINIRGIDSAAGASTTAIYIDDTPVQSRHIGFGSYNVFPQLFDIDRVEVLRGPQGTLFGESAEGGALRFLMPQPGLDHNSGYMRAEIASTQDGDPSYEAGAAVGGPIINGVLGFRASASYREDGGWLDRVTYTRPDPSNPLSLPVYASTTDQHANWQQTITARAALKWQATENLSVTPSIYYQRLVINDTSGYWVPLSNPGNTTFRTGNVLKNTSTDPFYVASLRLDWNLGFGQLVSNTSYYSRQQHSVSDTTQLVRALYASFALLPNIYPPPGAAAPEYFTDTQNNLYQEVRIASPDAKARVAWNAGVFYSNTNENVPSEGYDPTIGAETFAFSGFNVCSAPPGCPNGLTFTQPVNRIIEKQIALFGEINFRFTDTLKATAGVRLSKVDSSGESAIGGLGFGPTLIESSFSTTEKPVTPKAVLSWKPDANNLYYASAAKGYRTGGLNPGVGTFCDADLAALGVPPGANGLRELPPQYGADSLWSYELGAKNTLFGNRAQLNTSVFFIDWSNIQQNVYLPTCAEQFVANLGVAHSLGGEIELVAHPIDELALTAAVAYTDAYYTRGSCAGDLTYNGTACAGPSSPTPVSPIVSEGNGLLGAPWTILFSAEYHTALALLGGRTGYARVDYQHTTAQSRLLPYQDDKNALFDTTIPSLPSTSNLALRIGARFSGFDLSVFGNNLTNQHPQLSYSRDVASTVDNLYYARSVRPLTFGFTATYHF